MTITPEARRDILCAAVEEGAVLDVFQALRERHGGSDAAWFLAIQAEARAGLLKAYRYGGESRAAGSEFLPVDLGKARVGDVGHDYGDAVYLATTDKTLAAIRKLPAPAPGDSRWAMGLWPVKI